MMYFVCPRSHIDYLSLDVEGLELPILKTIPFDTLDISVISAEYLHGDKGAYVAFMETKGYKLHSDVRFLVPMLYLGGQDFVFVKKNLVIS